MSDARPIVTIPAAALDALSADARNILRIAVGPVTAHERATGVDAGIARMIIVHRYDLPNATKTEAITALFKAIGFAGSANATPPSVRVRIEESRTS